MRVNSVNPGAVKTKLYDVLGMGTEELDKFYKRCEDTHALKRIGDVMEIAKSIAFLASDDASFITGITLPIDGGKQLMCPI